MKKWIYGIVAVCLLVYMCGGSNDDDTDNSTTEQYESSSNGDVDEQMSVSFSNEQDIRNYLCCHQFVSNDGYTMRFGSNANEISINGTLLTSNIRIGLVSSTSAVIRTQGPYGNTTFELSVSGTDGVITDTKDGSSFYAR